MPIQHFQSAAYGEARASDVSTSDLLSPAILQGRDVVIINPFCHGGGDHALANKIANIASGVGCRVSIVPMSADQMRFAERPCRNVSPRGRADHGIESLIDPVFIVSPLSTVDPTSLADHIAELCDVHGFRARDAVLIEEMDVLASPARQPETFTAILSSRGFERVIVRRLGFGEGAIGYLPVSHEQVDAIKQRCERDLACLLDGLNLSLDRRSDYHLAYISSSTPITGAQNFIANVLIDADPQAAMLNFVMVVRGLDDRVKGVLLEVFPKMLSWKSTDGERTPDLQAAFSHAEIFWADAAGKHQGGTRLESAQKMTGTGARRLNIVFVDSLPQDLFLDFMALAKSGMASGDQSLSEFLSITGRLPHYDLQTWKTPLFKHLKAMAERIGGEPLKHHVASRVVGKKASGALCGDVHRIFRNAAPSDGVKTSMAEMDREVVSRTADGEIVDVLALLDQPGAPKEPPAV